MDVDEVITGIKRLPVNTKEYKNSNWVFKVTKSHILSSKCTGPSASECVDPDEDGAGNRCPFCVYTQSLSLPHLPDMVFASNTLSLSHSENGGLISFNAFDALKHVSNGKQLIEIACAEEWKEYRSETGHTEKVCKPFDWTFSTDYKGTLEGNWTVEASPDRIDLERLKKKDAILFFDEITLFEDELHDNGIAQLSIKVRVMPEMLYILQRYFMRVDSVLIKINDTRLFHDFSTNYFTREYTSREAKIPDLKVPPCLLLDPNQIASHLPLVKEINEKLTFKP